MAFRALKIEGAWEFTPTQLGDPRGVFLEWFQEAPFRSMTGNGLVLGQANLSVSAAGVIRGIHFADVPPGQAKYVTCPKGAILDVVVDIRVGSPTFGHWESVLLDDIDRRAIYLSEGLGHVFLSLEDNSTVIYLCSTPYSPAREHGVSPLDPEIGIVWPTLARDGSPLVTQVSAKDEVAPTLEEAAAAGLLPQYDQVLSYRSTL